MSCHIKWISGVCNLLMNVSSKEHSSIKCPLACVIAGPHSPRFFPWGYLKECFYSNHPDKIQEVKCVTKGEMAPVNQDLLH
jgi:hypothetical protein